MLCGQVNSARLVIHVHMVVLSLPFVPLVPTSLNQLSRPARHAHQVNAVHQCYIKTTLYQKHVYTQIVS